MGPVLRNTCTVRVVQQSWLVLEIFFEMKRFLKKSIFQK
eukprot:UN00503